jgi:hypothetical protein
VVSISGLEYKQERKSTYLSYVELAVNPDRRPLDSLEAGDIALLRSLGSKDHQAGVWALNVLSSALDERYEEVFHPLDDGGDVGPAEAVRSRESLGTGLKVFPNPAAEVVYVLGDFAGEQLGTVLLLSLQGEPLASRMIRPGELVYFDLSNLPTGMYVVRLVGTMHHDAQRFIHIR